MANEKVNPDALELKTRHINSEGQIEAVYGGGGLNVIVKSGGFDENALRGVHINIYQICDEGAGKQELDHFVVEAEPSPLRLRNIVNHLLHKRTLKTFNVTTSIQVEAESEVTAREAIKQIMFFSNRESLAEWNITEIQEVVEDKQD